MCVCVYVLSTFVHEGLKARLTVEGKAGELLLGGLVACGFCVCVCVRESMCVY
jgi:hypothetical protein